MTSSWSSHESKHECSSEVAAVRLHLLGFNTPGGAKPLGGFVFKIELSLEFWRFGAAKVQYCLQIYVASPKPPRGLGWGHVFIVKSGNGMV